MRVAPWGVIILILLGALGLASLLTGIGLSLQARHREHAAAVVVQHVTRLIDSLEALPSFPVEHH